MYLSLPSDRGYELQLRTNDKPSESLCLNPAHSAEQIRCKFLSELAVIDVSVNQEFCFYQCMFSAVSPLFNMATSKQKESMLETVAPLGIPFLPLTDTCILYIGVHEVRKPVPPKACTQWYWVCMARFW